MNSPTGKYWQNVQQTESNQWWLKPHEKVKNLGKNLKQGKILDIGCGMGRHTVLLAKMGFDVVGFDASEDGIAHTKKWLEENGVNADLQQANFLDWEYGDEKYEAVLSINAFHHALKDQVKKTAKEIARCLKEGGVFFANVPAFRELKENEKWIEEQTYMPMDGSEKGIPHFLFKKEQVEEFFPNFKIQIQSVKLNQCDDEHFDIYATKISPHNQ